MNEENRPTMFACQYLYGAYDCFVNGVSYYNNSKYGYVERSFAEIHRAWNALWMAEVQVTENGNLYLSDSNTLGIEDFVNKTRAFREKMDFQVDKAGYIFQQMQKKGTPINANFFLIYKLRNIGQHDFLEFAKGSYPELTATLNPYVIANFFNFLKAYDEVYAQVRKDCHNNHNGKSKGDSCARKYLMPPKELENFIHVPTSIKTLDLEARSRILDEEYQKQYRTTLSKKRRLENNLYTMIQNIQNTILARPEQPACNGTPAVSAQSDYQMRKHIEWKYPLNYIVSIAYNNVTFTTKLNDATENYIASFTYTSLSSIAAKIKGLHNMKRGSLTAFEKREIDTTRHFVQKVKEKMVEDGITEGPYWKTFWGQVRYNEKFVEHVSNVWQNNRQLL